MLDTNVVSELIRHPAGAGAQRAGATATGDLCVSVICAAELRFGLAKRGSATLTKRAEQVLTLLPVLPFAAPADVTYGRIRFHLERLGQPIGPNDLLLAAHALTLGLVFVTGNVAEFERVPGLTVENWIG
jgi:tRNA(fMet)-specific endonuclease VapC